MTESLLIILTAVNVIVVTTGLVLAWWLHRAIDDRLKLTKKLSDRTDRVLKQIDGSLQRWESLGNRTHFDALGRLTVAPPQRPI